MAFQYSVTLRNTQISQIQTTCGSSATLLIFAGTEPATCASGDPAGSVLATITLPATFLTSTSAVASLTGTWSVAASNTGTAQSFRIKDGSSVCHLQGNVTATGGGGDLTLNNTSITSGQTVTVTSFAVTAGNA